MLVIYTPKFGFAFAPTVPDEPALIPLWDKWGVTALFYLALFSHVHSGHRKIIDLEERDRSVIADMVLHNRGKAVIMGGKLTYPYKLYTDSTYPAAVEAFLNLPSLPDLKHLLYLERKLDEYRSSQDAIKLDSKDKEFKTKVAAVKDLRGIIKELDKEYREVEAHIHSLVEASGIITLDELWKTA